MDTATIRKAEGGYIVTVRYPIAGSPLAGGEAVCTTFDAAVTLLYRLLHFEWEVGKRCVVSLVADKALAGED